MFSDFNASCYYCNAVPVLSCILDFDDRPGKCCSAVYNSLCFQISHKMVNSLQMDAVLNHGSVLPNHLVQSGAFFLCFYHIPEQRKIPFSYYIKGKN